MKLINIFVISLFCAANMEKQICKQIFFLRFSITLYALSDDSIIG